MPSFSIITPTLGNSRYLSNAIDSVADQLGSDHPIEHLLIAPEGAQLPAGPDHPGIQLRPIESAARGAPEAINRGIERATGEIIGFLADDDIYLPAALDRVRAVFQERPEVDLVYGGVMQIDEDGFGYRACRSRPLTRSRIKRRCEVYQPGLFFRRELIERIGRLDATLQYHYWYDFVLRCFQHDCRFHRLRDFLGGKRRHRGNRHLGNRSASHEVAEAIERVELLSRRLGEVPARVALRLGHCCAAQQGLDALTPGYDASVLDNAANGLRTLHSPDFDSGWSKAVEWARLRASHVGFQARRSLRYPRELTRFMPRWIGQNLRDLFRSRLFQLNQHEPRAPRITQQVDATKSGSLSIGIVTPNRNSGEFLERTIQSVLSQDFSRLQYVIQDGHSTDNSVEIIQRYDDRLHHWASQPDSGQSQAINRGARHLDADIMAYLNSDDILMPGSLAYVSEYFRTHPEVDVIYGHRLIIDDSDQEVGRWILPRHDDRAIAFADYVPQETMFWRRRAWQAVGESLDESFQFAMDWDLILRFRAAGLQFVRVPRFLGAFRAIERQKTQTLLETLGETEMNRLRRRELGRIPTSRETRRAMRPYRIRQWVQHHAYTISGSALD